VFGLVLASELGVDGQHAHSNDRQTFGFEATNNFANEAAFDGIGLTENKSAIHRNKLSPPP